jgi:hypothetical protein
LCAGRLHRVAGQRIWTVSPLATKFGLRHVGDTVQIHRHLVLFNDIGVGPSRQLSRIPFLPGTAFRELCVSRWGFRWQVCPDGVVSGRRYRLSPFSVTATKKVVQRLTTSDPVAVPAAHLDVLRIAQEFLGRLGSGAEPAAIAVLFSENVEGLNSGRYWRFAPRTATRRRPRSQA